MSKNDNFPYWTDDWMKSQQEYLDTWTKLSEKMADTFQSTKRPPNPWIEALEQWESLIPETGEAQPYAERMLDQGKAFFEMSGEISKFLNMLNDVNKSTDEWQETLQVQMEEIKKSFDSGDGDLAAIWDKPLNAWESAMGSTVLDPQILFKNFDQQQADMSNPFYEQMNKFLSIPGVGPDREKQEQQQKYTRLWLDSQRKNQEYNSAIQRVGKETVERLVQKMIAMSEQKESLDSMREVYDLWVDCAEEAYADFAHSDEYQKVYGSMANSLMALKQETRNMLDSAASSMGMPSSKGFNTVLKRMQEMRREIKALQRSGNSSDETSELRAEVADLRKELAVLKKAISTKPAVAPSTSKTTTKKKIASTRKKVAKKKSTSRKTK